MADQTRLVKTLIDLIKIDSPSGEEDAMDLEVSSRLEALGRKTGGEVSAGHAFRPSGHR